MANITKATAWIAAVMLATACTNARDIKVHAALPSETMVLVESASTDHVTSRDIVVIPYEGQTHPPTSNPEQMVIPDVDEALIGHWRGEMPMVSHTHPISFDTTKTSRGNLTATFNVMGMDIRPLENNTDQNLRFSAQGNNISFLLVEDGVRFDGTLVSETEIAGTLDWLGRRQEMRFFKGTQPENHSDMMGHGMGSGDKMNVAILVFDGVDVLDWAGPMEVFVNAHTFNAYTVAADRRAYDGMGHRLYPEYTFTDMPEPDILIIPGGSVAALMHQKNITDWIRETSAKSDITMSVCNGAIALAGNSMLEGLEATTHSSWMEWLTAMAEEQNFSTVKGPRFVDNGKIVTTAGVSSGIDGALHLVARLKGLGVARMAARNMEYDWMPADTSRYR